MLRILFDGGKSKLLFQKYVKITLNDVSLN
jgi:hypothetical protein